MQAISTVNPVFTTSICDLLTDIYKVSTLNVMKALRESFKIHIFIPYKAASETIADRIKLTRI